MPFLGRPQGALFRPPPQSVPQLQEAAGQIIAASPLSRTVGPVGIAVLATETLLADFTDSDQGGGLAVFANTGPNSIFYSLHNSAKKGPGVTAANGIPLAAGAKDFLDNLAGLALWAVCTVAQVSPADTRVNGGKI